MIQSFISCFEECIKSNCSYSYYVALACGVSMSSKSDCVSQIVRTINTEQKEGRNF